MSNYERMKEMVVSGLHPGLALNEVFVKDFFKTASAFAEEITMSIPATWRVLNGKSAISAMFAIKLEAIPHIEITAEQFLELQNMFDLKSARAKLLEIEAEKKS